MKRINLEIQDFEEKKTKADKPFTRFKTQSAEYGAKWMSCFDLAECEKLKEFNKKVVSADVKESGDFQNIAKCYGEGEGDFEVKTEAVSSGNQVAKEYKLTEESIRSNALRCAIELQGQDHKDGEFEGGVIVLARQLETYIRNG